jgi:hypothetical protein
MSNHAHPVDRLIAELVPVRDEELAAEFRTPEAAAVFREIVASRVTDPRRARTNRPRRRLVVFGIAAALAAVLAIPAFGVGEGIVSLFSGWRDRDAPVPTRSDVLIAFGEAGVPWKIVATKSDRGLCLGLFHQAGDDELASARCGYLDVRGNFPPEIRGDPASTCIATPTRLVPCGSLPRHWIGPVGAGADSSVGLDHHFVFGPLAEDVASVALVFTDGQTRSAQVVEQPGGLPLNFYWAAWPADEDALVVKVAIARDREGRVLERRVPAWNGNPTGDPSGPAPPAPLGE